jgi:hypothetical protein
MDGVDGARPGEVDGAKWMGLARSRHGLRAGWKNHRGDTRDGRSIPPRFTTHPYPGESRSLDLALIANPDDL